MPGMEKITSRAVRGLILQALENTQVQSWVGQLSARFNSDQATEEYADLGMTPAMREWIGGRSPQELRERSFSIKNVKYEASIITPVDYLRRDKLGRLNERIGQLAVRATEHWNKLASQLIVDGETTACYDSQFFFDTDHAEGSSGVQSNDISVTLASQPASLHGTPANPSPEEMAASIFKGIEQILGFKDDQAEPLNDGASSFAVMVPLGLMRSASAAINNTALESGVINTLKTAGFNLDLVVNPRLTSLGSWTTKFAIFRTNAPGRPFIQQEEQGVRVAAKAEGSDFEFNEDAHEYGVSAIRAMGYAAWSSACLVTMV